MTVYGRHGWTVAKAKEECARLSYLASIGVWEADGQDEKAPAPVPKTFWEVADVWWELVRNEFRPRTKTDYVWRLNSHLLPFFGDMPVELIDVAAVDDYRAGRVAESRRRRIAVESGKPLRDEKGKPLRPLSNATINKTLTLLGTILDFAEERHLIDRNPMRVNPKRRRLPSNAPKQSYVDRADGISAVLEAAGELDREALADRANMRRAVLATFLFAGLRIGELCSLRWKHVDLANGRLRVVESKTDAGVRQVNLVPALREELTQWKASTKFSSQADFVFPTEKGTANRADNVRARIVKPVFARASDLLQAEGRSPLPEGLTPHSLRRTCTSVLIAIGWDPGMVMDHLGHATEGMTMSVYRKRMNHSDAEKAALKALVDGTAGFEHDLTDPPGEVPHGLAQPSVASPGEGSDGT